MALIVTGQQPAIFGIEHEEQTIERMEVFRLETEVYDVATERVIGRHQDPPRLTLETLTANFTGIHHAGEPARHRLAPQAKHECQDQ